MNKQPRQCVAGTVSASLKPVMVFLPTYKVSNECAPFVLMKSVSSRFSTVALNLSATSLSTK